MEYVFAILAGIVVLMYVVERIRWRRRLEARSRVTFYPHVTASGEFMCFCMTPRASRESHSTDEVRFP